MTYFNNIKVRHSATVNMGKGCTLIVLKDVIVANAKIGMTL
jgi:hypothetical protein